MKNAAFGKKALALALAFCLIGQAGALGVFGGAYAAQKTDAAETASEDAAIVETEEETDSGAPEEDTITDSEEDEEFEGETVTVVPDWDCADNDELLEGYLESILYNEVTVTAAAAYGTYGTTYFSGANLATYNALKSDIEDIAAGTTSSTVLSYSGTDLGWTWTWEELGLTDGAGSATAEVKSAVSNAFDSQVLYTDLMNVLMADCPYDFYWFDKTTGMSLSYTYGYNTTSVYISRLKITFYVAEEFQGGSDTTVDTSAVAAAEAAAAAAQEIVAQYAGCNDWDKLAAYRGEICALATYNYSAASDSSASYGNPWQLIWVFDGDDSTGVVCEGYSKAFQYLCDLSEFTNVTCYTVNGTMADSSSAGDHMWNLIQYNGVTFLCDITNSDTGTLGANGGLFMVCADDASYSNSESYGFVISGTSIDYAYNSTTLGLYSEDVLTLGSLASAGAAVTGISVDPTAVTLAIGGTQTLTVTLTPTNPYNSNYSFESSDSSIATVSDDGIVTGVAYGTCTITVTSEDGGYAATCEVTVAPCHYCHVHEWEAVYETKYICTTCGESFDNIDDLTIHVFLVDGGSYTVKSTLTHYECSTCGESSDDGSEYGIAYPMEYVEGAEATCVSEGNIGYWICTNCGAMFADAEATKELTSGDITISIDPDNHTGETYILNTIEATCSTEGYTGDTYCSDCGEMIEEGEVIAKLAHTLTHHQATAATCTTTGNIEYWECENCGAMFADAEATEELTSDDIVTAATGHSAGSAVTENIVAATATTAGSYDSVVYCTLCGAELSRTAVTVPATGGDSGDTGSGGSGDSGDSGDTGGDTAHTHSYTSAVTKAATCTTDGVMTYTCSCGDSYTEAIPATGHSWDDGTVTTAATHTATGVKTYTCTVCGETKTETIAKLAFLFDDVQNASEYYYDAVYWAYDNGITTGTSDTLFSPGDSCTRAQFVTFLWRLAGEPTPTTASCGFTDLDTGEYYYRAVLWAVEQGVTNGTSATAFSPNDEISRAQAVTMLYRYAGSPSVAGLSNSFNDVPSGEYYYNAVLWAVKSGITNGTSATKFSPDDTCDRAMMVTFLHRFAG